MNFKLTEKGKFHIGNHSRWQIYRTSSHFMNGHDILKSLYIVWTPSILLARVFFSYELIAVQIFQLPNIKVHSQIHDFEVEHVVKPSVTTWNSKNFLGDDL